MDSQSIKTTGVGGEQRGYDGGKKVKGRKRHLLVDTQGLVLTVRVHSAKVQDQEGIKLLLELAQDRLPQRLSHLWLDAGYTGESKGADWVEKVLGWTAEIVRHPPKLAPEELMRIWVSEWAKEGVAMDPEKLSGSRRFGDLTRSLVVEPTSSRQRHTRRMSTEPETCRESIEACLDVAMVRLMVSRLACR